MDMRLLFLAQPLDPKTRRSLYEIDCAPRVPWISDTFAGIWRSDVATGRSEPPARVAGRSTERPRATVETQKVSCMPTLTMRPGKIAPGIRNAEPVAGQYYFVTFSRSVRPGNVLRKRTMRAARRRRQTGNCIEGAEIRRRSRTCGMPPTCCRRCGFPRRRAVRGAARFRPETAKVTK